MFIKLLLAVLMGIALVGCGSDKDMPIEVSPDLENPHVEKFSLEGYEGRTVSTDMLDGTWVMVSKSTYDISSDYKSESGNSYIKQILTIYNDNDQYFAGDCQGDNFPVVFSGNTLKFHHYHAPLVVTNNTSLSQSSNESILQEDGSKKVQIWDTKAIKVSDQIYPFAYWNYEVSGGETETGQANSICFTALLAVKKELEETIYTTQTDGVIMPPILVGNTKSTWADIGKESNEYDTLTFISSSRVDVFSERHADVMVDFEVDFTPGAEQLVFEAGDGDKYVNGMIEIKL